MVMEKLFLSLSLPADWEDDKALLYLLRGDGLRRRRSHGTWFEWVKGALVADNAINTPDDAGGRGQDTGVIC